MKTLVSSGSGALLYARALAWVWAGALAPHQLVRLHQSFPALYTVPVTVMGLGRGEVGAEGGSPPLPTHASCERL